MRAQAALPLPLALFRTLRPLPDLQLEYLILRISTCRCKRDACSAALLKKAKYFRSFYTYKYLHISILPIRIYRPLHPHLPTADLSYWQFQHIITRAVILLATPDVVDTHGTQSTHITHACPCSVQKTSRYLVRTLVCTERASTNLSIPFQIDRGIRDPPAVSVVVSVESFLPHVQR